MRRFWCVAQALVMVMGSACNKGGSDSGGSKAEDETPPPVESVTVSSKEMYLKLIGAALTDAEVPEGSVNLITSYTSEKFPEFAKTSEGASLTQDGADQEYAAASASFQQELTQRLALGLRAYSADKFNKAALATIQLSQAIQDEVDKALGGKLDLTKTVTAEQLEAALTSIRTLYGQMKTDGLALGSLVVVTDFGAQNRAALLASTLVGANQTVGPDQMPTGATGVDGQGNLAKVGSVSALIQSSLDAEVKHAEKEGTGADPQATAKNFLRTLSAELANAAVRNGVSADELKEAEAGLNEAVANHNKNASKENKIDETEIKANLSKAKKITEEDTVCRIHISGYGPTTNYWNGNYYLTTELVCKKGIIGAFDTVSAHKDEVKVEGLPEGTKPLGYGWYGKYVGTEVWSVVMRQWPIGGAVQGKEYVLPANFRVEFPAIFFAGGKVPEDCSNIYPNPCLYVPVNVTVKGKVTDLHGTIVLQNNGGDDVTVTTTAKGDKAFTFPKAVIEGNAYKVTVKTQPEHQTCTVQSGSGNATADMADIVVACAYKTYSISGTVTGHSGTVTVTAGDQEATIDAETETYSITGLTAYGAYDVELSAWPEGQTCAIDDSAAITSLTGDVTGVDVTCTTLQTFTLGGTATGITGDVILFDFGAKNGEKYITISADGAFQFPGTRGEGYNYSINFYPAPIDYPNCELTNYTGIMSADVTNITLTCTTD